MGATGAYAYYQEAQKHCLSDTVQENLSRVHEFVLRFHCAVAKINVTLWQVPQQHILNFSC